MRLVARCIAAVAVAFVMVPALYADDTPKPGDEAKSTKPAASVVAPPAAPQPQPILDVTPPPAFALDSQSGPGVGAGPTPAMRSWRGTGDYTPKVEWLLGYSFWRAVPSSSGNRMAYLHGGSTSVAYNFNRYLGLVADFGGYDDSRLTLYDVNSTSTVHSNGSAYTFLAGPRLSYRKYQAFTPFMQVLFGGAYATSVTITGCSGSPACTPLGSEIPFAMTAGGGLDVKLTRHVALRLFQAEYLLTRFRDTSSSTGQTGTQNNVRLSAGIVFRFGGYPPQPPAPAPLPPVASCSADKSVIYVGSGEMVAVRAEASDPGNNSLTYAWTSSNGTVEGSGPTVRWNSTGTAIGTYTVKVRVDNGHGGTVGCAAEIRVEVQPNHPPTMSCSADRSSVLAGDSVQITAAASDPDNDPLTFSWNATNGRVVGSGSAVSFDTSGLRPGAYVVTGRVNDGRDGNAECSVNVDVQPSAKQTQLEKNLSLHSIYFQTARPTESNPGGGLLESQQEVLAALASDFTNYLSFKPDAHLILAGHADLRGPDAYNKSLTERRVERAKSFLVEHGVPEGDIEVQALGKEDDLTADQVKVQMQDNPDLSPEDRQKMLANLPVIVLANNRRVDVTLSTTGQTSLRRYPFNAKDALALITANGASKDARARKKP